MTSLVVVLVAAVAGVAVALQGSFTGAIQERMGTLETVFITYAPGGLVIAVIMALTRGGNLRAGAGLPWYVFTSGLIGLVIVGAIAFAVPRIGLVGTLSLALVAQFGLGALFDHFGWLGSALRPMDLQRGAGLAVLAFGTWLVLR